MGDLRTFYGTLTAVYGPLYQIHAPLGSSYISTLLTNKKIIPQHCLEQFECLFSDQRTVQESSLAKIPQIDVKLELGCPSTRKETKKVTFQLKVGKSPGINGIPANVYQYGGKAVLAKFQDLITSCWKKGTLLQDLRDAVIVSEQEQGRKIRLFKLSRHHSALHCRQNLSLASG